MLIPEQRSIEQYHTSGSGFLAIPAISIQALHRKRKIRGSRIPPIYIQIKCLQDDCDIKFSSNNFISVSRFLGYLFSR